MDTLTNSENLLDQADKTLKNWCVFTYLPSGTVLRSGVVVAPDQAEEFGYFRPTNDRPMLKDVNPGRGKLETDLFRALVSANRQADIDGIDSQKNLFVSSWQAEDDPKDSILAIGGVQTPTEADNRGPKPWIISLQLPREVTGDLILSINEKPEFIDSLIKKLFPNLDAVDKNPKSGLRRYKSESIRVIDMDKFKVQYPNSHTISRITLPHILGKLPVLKPAQPIGEWD